MGRDYSNTGGAESSGGNLIFIQPNFETGKFIRKDRQKNVIEEHSSWAGYVDNLKLRYNEGNAEYKIPAGWELKLDLACQDMLADDKAIKSFIFGFKIRSRSATALLNQLLTAIEDPQWTGFLRMTFPKELKDGQDYYPLWFNWSVDGIRYENYFAWDEVNNNGFLGVIRSELVNTLSTGERIYDHGPNERFWIGLIVNHIQPSMQKAEPNKKEDFNGLGLEQYLLAMSEYKEITSTNDNVLKGNFIITDTESSGNSNQQPIQNQSSQAKSETPKESKIYTVDQAKQIFVKKTTTMNNTEKVSFWPSFCKWIKDEFTGLSHLEIYEYANAIYKPLGYKIDDEGDLKEIAKDIFMMDDDDLPF